MNRSEQDLIHRHACWRCMLYVISYKVLGSAYICILINCNLRDDRWVRTKTRWRIYKVLSVYVFLADVFCWWLISIEFMYVLSWKMCRIWISAFSKLHRCTLDGDGNYKEIIEISRLLIMLSGGERKYICPRRDYGHPRGFP